MVDEFTRQLSTGQGEVVATCFVGESEVVAGLTPLRAVGRDFTASAAMVRHEMRKFVEKSALDLRFSEGDEAGVKDDLDAAWVCQARGASHPVVPKDGDFLGQCLQPELVECGASQACEVGGGFEVGRDG